MAKVIKSAGTFEILTPYKELREQLKRIEIAGRTCYQSLKGKVTNKSASNFISMLIKRGHLSVIEHSSLTVRFKNLSRGFTHELVRHRLCSFSQESTRYVDYAKGCDKPDLDRFQIVVIAPPHKDENEKIKLENGRELSFKDMINEVEMFYRGLRKAGWAPEDARQILPTGLKAEIVVTANFREWMHIMYLRTSKFAHWEIRSVMIDLLKRLKKILPPIFEPFHIVGKDINGIPYTETDGVF